MNYQDSEFQLIPHLIENLQTASPFEGELVISYSPSGRYSLTISFNKDDSENGSVFSYKITITDMALLKTTNYNVVSGTVIGFRWLSEKEVSVYVPYSTSSRRDWMHIPYILRTLILSIDHQQYSATIISQTDQLIERYELRNCIIPFLIKSRASPRMTIQGQEFIALTIGSGITLCPYDIRSQKRQTPFRISIEYGFILMDNFERNMPIFKNSKIFFPRRIGDWVERRDGRARTFLDMFTVVDLTNINLEDDFCIITVADLTTIDILNDVILEHVPQYQSKIWQDDQVAVVISHGKWTSKMMVTVIDLSTLKAHQKIVPLDSPWMIATFHRQHLVFWQNREVDRKQYLACSKTYAGGCVPSLFNICSHILNSYHATSSSSDAAWNQNLRKPTMLLQILFHILRLFQFNKTQKTKRPVTLPNYEKYLHVMYR